MKRGPSDDPYATERPRKKQRRMTKEERMLGSWGDSGSDGSSDGSGSDGADDAIARGLGFGGGGASFASGRGQAGSGADQPRRPRGLRAPVSFVPSGARTGRGEGDEQDEQQEPADATTAIRQLLVQEQRRKRDKARRREEDDSEGGSGDSDEDNGAARQAAANSSGSSSWWGVSRAGSSGAGSTSGLGRAGLGAGSRRGSEDEEEEAEEESFFRPSFGRRSRDDDNDDEDEGPMRGRRGLGAAMEDDSGSGISEAEAEDEDEEAALRRPAFSSSSSGAAGRAGPAAQRPVSKPSAAATAAKSRGALASLLAGLLPAKPVPQPQPPPLPKAEPAPVPAPAPPVEEEPEEEEGLDDVERLRRYGFAGMKKRRAAASAAASAAAAAAAAAAPPAAPAPEAAEPPAAAAAEFERHTKGFASRYLAKFGFKGRLGKEEQGLARPIEVKVRPDRLGLAYGSFKEASGLKHNKDVMADISGRKPAAEEASSEEEGGKGAGSKPAAAAGAAQPRAGPKPPKPPKRVYVTAAEVMKAASGGTSSSGGLKIIDMRGPAGPRVVDDWSAAAEVPVLGPEVKAGQELRHNLRLLAEEAEVEVRTLTRKLQTSSTSADEAGRLRKEAAAAAAEALAKQAALEATHSRFAHFTTAVQEGKTALEASIAAARGGGVQEVGGDLSPLETAAGVLDEACDAFAAIWAADAETALTHNMLAVVAPVLGAVLGCVTPAWDGLSAEAHGGLVALVGALRRWLWTVASIPRRFAGSDGGALASDSEGDDAEPNGEGGLRHYSHAVRTPAQARAAMSRRLASEAARDVSAAVEKSLVERLRALCSGPGSSRGGRWVPTGDPSLAIAAVCLLAPAAAYGGKASGGGGDWAAAATRAGRTVVKLRAPPPSSLDSAAAAVEAGGRLDVISLASYRSFLDSVVMPRLTAAVEAWEPTAVAELPIHGWLLPWDQPHLLGGGSGAEAALLASGAGSGQLGLPLGSTLARLYPTVRTKIGTALAGWHPADPSARAMLQPWARVWGARATEALLVRTIVQRLIGAVRSAVFTGPDAPPPPPRVVEPPSGYTATTPVPASVALTWVTAWAGLLPSSHLLSILEGEFLPRWLGALLGGIAAMAAAGASSGTIAASAARWWAAWRSTGYLSNSLLSHPRLVPHMGLALAIVDALADAAVDTPFAAASFTAAVPPLPDPAATSYQSVVAARAKKAPRAAAAEASAAAPAPGAPIGAEQASFRDLVVAALEAGGVGVLPHPTKAAVGGAPVLLAVPPSETSRRSEGLPFYLSGGVAFIDQAANSGAAAITTRWRPVSLQDLLAAAGADALAAFSALGLP